MLGAGYELGAHIRATKNQMRRSVCSQAAVQTVCHSPPRRTGPPALSPAAASAAITNEVLMLERGCDADRRRTDLLVALAGAMMPAVFLPRPPAWLGMEARCYCKRGCASITSELCSWRCFSRPIFGRGASGAVRCSRSGSLRHIQKRAVVRVFGQFQLGQIHLAKPDRIPDALAPPCVHNTRF